MLHPAHSRDKGGINMHECIYKLKCGQSATIFSITTFRELKAYSHCYHRGYLIMIALLLLLTAILKVSAVSEQGLVKLRYTRRGKCFLI